MPKLYFFFTIKMLMNVRLLKTTTAIPTLCVPTLKDPMSAAVLKGMKEMAETAQVTIKVFFFF